jgi:SAM-dependent methyltransferase
VTEVFNEEYASAYDVMYADKDNGAECDAVLALLERFGDGKITRFLDLGCGTGRHAVEFATRGFDVTGVDFSEAMLSRARQRAHAGGALRFVQGDARAYRSATPFDAVLMNFNVLGYMNSNDDLTAALATARANLRAGGVFVADFWYGPAVVADPPGDRLREIVAGDRRFLRHSHGVHEADHQRIRIAIRVIELQGDRVRADSEEVHGMRYFFPLELELALRTHGFRLAAMTGYPDVDQPASSGAWMAALVAVAV